MNIPHRFTHRRGRVLLPLIPTCALFGGSAVGTDDAAAGFPVVFALEVVSDVSVDGTGGPAASSPASNG